MGATHERRLLSAVLASGDIRPALAKGITVEAMQSYPEEWAWVLDRYTTTKSVPTKGDFKVHFPAWTGIRDVVDVDLHAGVVANEHAKNLTYGLLNQGADDLQAGVPVPKLLEKLAQGQRTVAKALGGNGAVDSRLSDSRDYLAEVQRRRKLAASGGAGINTGLATLDEATGGLTEGQLVIFCSRPSVGKSFLIGRTAIEALTHGKTCLIFSLEMNRFAVQTRLMSMLAYKDPHAQPIDPSAVRKGSIGRSGVLDMNRFMKRTFASGTMGDVHIVDNSDPGNPLNEYQVQAAIERVRPDIVFLDYLQLFARMNAKGGMDLRLEVARMSSLCKALGDMYRVPFVTASQINRPGESKTNPPGLSTLAESDSPGQDADVIVTMVNPSRTTRKACIAKNREGPDNDIFHIHFDPSQGCIEEVTAEQAEQIAADEVLA